MNLEQLKEQCETFLRADQIAIYETAPTLIARIETLEKSLEWQPIETAPHLEWAERGIRGLVTDGIFISTADGLGVYPDGRIGGSMPSMHGTLQEWGVTHWRPLPEPPTEATKGDAVE